MNQSAMLARFAREGDFDVFLLAGRYTLLDHEALAELLPLCVEKRDRGHDRRRDELRASSPTRDPAAGSTTRPAPPDVLDRARRLGEVCARHGVPLKAAAVQFPLAHPAAVAAPGRRPVRRPPRRVPGAARGADPGGPLGRAPPRGPDPGRRADARRDRTTPLRGRRPPPPLAGPDAGRLPVADRRRWRRSAGRSGPPTSRRSSRPRRSTRPSSSRRDRASRETEGFLADGGRGRRSSPASSAGWT